MVQVVISAEDKIKKARFISWISMGVASLFLFLNLLLVLTMYQMGGRLTVMTQLFNARTRGTETLVLNDILNRKVGDLDVLEKAFIHRFIEERNFQIPDPWEMMRRWGPKGTLALTTHPSEFRPVYSKNDERIKKVLESFPTHADNIQIISRVGHSWIVSFDLWTHTPTGSTKQEKRFNIVVDFLPSYAQKVATPDNFYNPLGMVITDYTDTNVKNN